MERNGDHIVIRALRFFIIGLFFLIVCYLAVLSGFSTTAIRYEEHSYLIRDSVWINLLAECLFLMGLYAGGKALLRWKGRRNKANCRLRFEHESIKRALYFFTAAVCTVFVLSSRLKPRADQLEVIQAAANFLDGNYSSLDKGRYLFAYPNQAGIVLFLYYLGLLFGKQNAIVIQLLNIAAVLQIQRMSVSIAAHKKGMYAALFSAMVWRCATIWRKIDSI